MGYEMGYEIDPWQTSPPFPTVLSLSQTSLVQKGAIIEVAFNPWVGFYLFLVEKKGGVGQRPNLSRFNNYVEYLYFKMKTWKQLQIFWDKGISCAN